LIQESTRWLSSELIENVTEFSRGTVKLIVGAQACDPVHFRRFGYFGKRLNALVRDRK
jgi:hypothetical protein